jgi:hypothetical protein
VSGSAAVALSMSRIIAAAAMPALHIVAVPRLT